MSVRKPRRLPGSRSKRRKKLTASVTRQRWLKKPVKKPKIPPVEKLKRPRRPNK